MSPVTWAGARYVEKLVMIGPPNAGSLDALVTKKTASFDRRGRLQIVDKGPGDGVVLRSSALLDERLKDQQMGRLVSPVRWDQVFFVFAGHVDLTRVPVFTDNLLFILLESPRPL